MTGFRRMASGQKEIVSEEFSKTKRRPREKNLPSCMLVGGSRLEREIRRDQVMRGERRE